MINRLITIIGYALCLGCAAMMWVITWLAVEWGSGMAYVILASSAIYTWLCWLGWHSPEAAEAEEVSEVIRRRYL